MYGIYANIWAILMVNVTINIAYIRILWVWTNLSVFPVASAVTSHRLLEDAAQDELWRFARARCRDPQAAIARRSAGCSWLREIPWEIPGEIHMKNPMGKHVNLRGLIIEKY